MALKRLDLYQIDKPAGANKSAQIKTDPDKPVFNAISPYEIASFITASPDADLKNLRIQLGIRASTLVMTVSVRTNRARKSTGS